MTDRVKALVVTLDDDYRIDDVEALVNAIRMMKMVKSVDVNITNVDDHANRVRIAREYEVAIYETLKNLRNA